jgi:hypothetical protein
MEIVKVWGENRQNSTEKYATTIKTSWIVKLLGFNDKILAILEKMVAKILWQ